MAVKSMQDVLVEELREIYDAEKHAARAYPRLVRAATSDRLKQAFEDHMEKTQAQVKRLEQVFGEMKVSARAKSCAAVRGFIGDAEARIGADMPGELLDVALLAEAQKIEHFEIAAYGSAHAFAQALGLDQVAQRLKETLEEEKAADKMLNQVALRDVNKKALQVGGAAAGEKPAARRTTARRGAAGTRAPARGRTAAPGRGRATRAAGTAGRKAGGRRRQVAEMATAANKPGIEPTTGQASDGTTAARGPGESPMREDAER